MQPDLTSKDSPMIRTRLMERMPQLWRSPMVYLAAAVLGLFALTFGDWAEMAHQWWSISTYNHVLFVPLIVGWLVYTRWDPLSQLVPSAWWPGLIPLAGALFLWLLGSIAGVNTASQLGAVVALQAVIVTILGLRVALALAFPLAYLIFLVPFGDELVPALQMITAKLVIALTEWSGIPAVIDGVFIDTPVGLFEVAEACSGVKFLIAMVALGVLVSYACFTKWSHRAGFMAVAIAVPILANGVRAWGTIYIAQFQGIEFAEGFDHVFYGWVFFALVVVLVFAMAWRWFDRDPDDLGLDFTVAKGSLADRLATAGAIRNWLALAIAMALAAVAVGWNVMAMKVEAENPEAIALPQVPGWAIAPYEPFAAWEPKASGADHRLLGRYVTPEGQQVDVFVALYASQDEGRDASAFGEGAFDPDSDWRWLQRGPKAHNALSDYLLVYGKHKRLVQTSYRTADLTTGSAAQLKLATMRDRLLLRENPTTILVLSSELQEAGAAERSIAAFRNAIGDEGEWLDRIAELR